MEGYTLITNPRSSHILTFFLTTLLFITFITSPISAASTKATLKFIKITCNTTTYSSLCFKTLSPYASSIKTSSLKLSYTALSITIKAARGTSTVITRLAKQKGITKIEAAAIRDCIENIQDSIDEFKQAQKAMSRLSGPDREFQMSNAKTWASAAITDESTCLEGFSGRKVNPVVKSKIKSTVNTVGRLSSISLSLINHLNYESSKVASNID